MSWNHLCTKCGTLPCTLATVLRYFHIFWIPTLPLTRKAVVTCEQCHHTEVLPKSSGAPRARPPLWSFAGLVLIGLLVGYVRHVGVRDLAEARMAAADPRVGDTFIFKIEKGLPDAGLYALVSLIEDLGDGFEAGFGNLAYGTTDGARKGFLKLDRSRRVNFLKPERFKFSIEDLRKLDVEGVMRDSL